LQRTVGTLCADSHPGAYSGQDAYTGRLIPSPAFSLQGAGHTSQNSQGSGWNEEVSFTLNRLDVHGVVQPIPFKETADCLTAAYGTKWNGNASADNGSLFVNQPVYEMHGQDSRVRDLGDTCSTVTSKWGTSGGNVPVTTQTMAVRRLTCVECERLQGFPDNYTDIKSKNKPTPDGPRYKALGNSMAVPVMRWIGERIQKVEALNVP
jgi:DNA (cytosine-5)-methyltransferase 1